MIAESTRLHSSHLADLRSSGLTDETIREAGLFSEDDHHKLSAWLNRDYPKRCGSALVFTFRESTGELNGFKRVKPSSPRRDRNGRPIKYEAPRGAMNRAYLPAGVTALLREPVELLLTEGEKKALAATQAGFPCIGLVGVFGWKAGKKADSLIPDLEAVNWSGRQVRIVFDSDLADKPEVQDAESRLAAQLAARGAIVRVVHLPDGPIGDDGKPRKQGLDDFLLASGAGELRKLLDAAETPEPVQHGGKTPANLLDPMIEARAFLAGIQKQGQYLRRLHGDCYGFDGRVYRPISDDELRSQIIKSLDHSVSFLTRGFISNVEACLYSLVEMPTGIAFNAWLGKGRRERNLLALQNGLLDVDALLADREPVLLPHSHEWFSVVCLPYAWNVEATCPRWESFLAEVLVGDVERISILQEFLGWCLIRDASFQRFMLFEGEGANGKSVVLAVCRGVLGAGNVSHVPLELFGDKFRLASTLGKLANIAPEIGELDKVCEGFLKSFTAGDSMQFERKFKDTIEAVPTARLIMATNNRPRFSDRSGGLWRRMLLIPFEVTIPEERQIVGMDKVEFWADELPGVLCWALRGLIRLTENKRFTRSTVVEDAVAEYREESNPARLFLTENYELSTNGQVKTSDIYKQYRDWSESNGYRPLGEQMFGREVRRAFPSAHKSRLRVAGSREMTYVGIEETPVVT